MDTIRVEKYNQFHDRKVDLSDQIMGKGLPTNSRSMVVPILTASPVGMWSESDYADQFPGIETITVTYGVVTTRKRRERVVETKTWGTRKVEFIEYWWEDYFWFQPESVDGKRIDGGPA